MEQRLENWISKSEYLCRVQNRYGAALDELGRKHDDLLDLLRDLVACAADDHLNISDVRELKAKFSFFWSIARLYEARDAETLSQLHTEFAEVTIRRVLKIAAQEQPFASQIKHRKDEPFLCGLFILGLGKLGAWDLNFSSDIDLVAFYSAEKFDVAAGYGKGDVCHRLIGRFTELLSKEVDGEFIWRVDWRLRPNAASAQLVQEEEHAEEFYFLHSQPWHRLAMVKARVVAGDMAAGSSFLDSISAYIWRQNLDFEMIDEIYRLKSKINREHPSLQKVRREGELDNLDATRGFNLKLGRGGIREVEFIANAIQLLWGGKKPALRKPSTIAVLREIAEQQLFDDGIIVELIQSYRYFRWVEDGVQIRDNRQEHTVPLEDDAYSKCCSLLQVQESELENTIAQHRTFVANCFDGLLEEKQKKLADNNKNEEPGWVETLSDGAQKIWQSWNEGFGLYGVGSASERRLQPLLTHLTKTLSGCDQDHSVAVNYLHDFLRSMPKIGQYLRLLAEIPRLREDVLQQVVAVPFLRGLLKQSPHIIDYLLEPASITAQEADGTGPFFDRAGQDYFVLQNPAYEIRLERLRRHVNETLYSYGLQTVTGVWSSSSLSQNLTAFAQHTLNLAIRITNEYYEIDEPPVAVLAMGKFGMHAMAPLSDLDLIFISDPNADYEFSVEYSRRLQHLMSLRTKEGVAFEMDMRLRPSGNSGPPTVTLKSFDNYQKNYAKTWEHIALVAGRAVAGSPLLLKAIEQIRIEVLSRPRNPDQFKLDAAKMLSRIQDQRIDARNSSDLNIKLRAGGLMELDYLYACIILLNNNLVAVDYSLSYDNLLAKSRAQISNKPSTLDDSDLLLAALHFLRKLQIWERLLGLKNADLSDIPSLYITVVLKDLGHSSLDGLRSELHDASRLVRTKIDQMQDNFEKDKPTSWQDWQEKSVDWL